VNNLQELVNNTEEYGTLHLDFDEYFGQVLITRPVTIEGNNSTVCAKAGPVISIQSEGIHLKNLRVEVTAPAPKDEASALALWVKDHVKVTLDNIVVKGNVSGLVIEDGAWNYPDILHLQPVVPNKKNYFAFDMDVPISCVLETDIAGLRIVNPGIKIPGPNTIELEVDSLREDTILFGNIEINSNDLKRIISVSGGSFGTSANVPKPNKNKPVRLGETIAAPKSVPAPKAKPARAVTSDSGKSKKLLIAAGLAICLITLIVFLAFSFLGSSGDEKSENGSDDSQKPTAEIRGIQKSYTQGSAISLTAVGEDDQSVSQMAFRVENTSISQSWDVGGQSVAQKYDFPTSELKPGTYKYVLAVDDRAGNSGSCSGNFQIREKPDTVQPVGKIAGIRDSYTRGDEVSYTIQASDNKALKKITFKIAEMPSEAKAWQASGPSASYKSSFPTKDWKPGTYSYSLLTEDMGGNVGEQTGEFVLKEVQYGEVNIVTRPWAEIFIDGKSFGNSPKRLKLLAGKVEIRFVNKAKNIDHTETITVTPDELTKKSLKLK